MTPFTGLTAHRAAASDALGVLDQVRESVAAAKAELAQIERAPVLVTEAMGEFGDWLDAAATNAVDRLNVSYLLEPNRAASGLKLPFVVTRGPDGALVQDATMAVETLLGLVLAANRKAVLELVKGQLSDFADGRETIAGDDRAARVAAAQADLLSAELMKEAAIRQLEWMGVEVARRADADPAAVLASDASLPK